MILRRAAVAASALLLLAALSGCAGSSAADPPAASATAAGVASIAVVGDSISLGVNACGKVDTCPAASWAIGTDPAVDSLAARLTARDGTTPATTAVARPGAAVADASAALGTATDALRASDADLVVVLLGANDACTSAAASVTPVDTFAAGYARLLQGIRGALPEAAIVAYSVPDLGQLWEVGRTDPAAVRLWNASSSCQSLLANADSDAAADVARRAGVEQTVQGYNAAIAAACAAVADCFGDDGAVHATTFSASDVSSIDHFHPSIAGQAALAASAWPAVERALSG